ncbi:MAG: autotransporter outer membrane beta-barrel domain-containing protein [Opitutaceae bacterium]|nr:autotransporter outer membrane beta-barrel domain-containing protein [Opitutaceae bacterium]
MTNSLAGSGVKVVGAGSHVKLDAGGTGKTIVVNITNPALAANQTSEAAALYASGGRVDVIGNLALDSMQMRSYGFWASGSTGIINVTGNTVMETHGDESFGMRLDGGNIALAGDLSMINGRTLSVAGATGNGSAGVRATSGTLTVTGSTYVETHGGIAAVGNSLPTNESSYGLWNASASRVTGSGALMTFGAATIVTHGAAAHGVYNDSIQGLMTFGGPVSIITHGGEGTVAWRRQVFNTNETVGAHGVNSALSGTTIFNDTLTIANDGAGAGGVRSIGGLVQTRDVNVTTAGERAHGIAASSTMTYLGEIQVNGLADITTSGSGAHAVYASGSGRVGLGGLRVGGLGQDALAISATGGSVISGSGQFTGAGGIRASGSASVDLAMTAGSDFTGGIQAVGSASAALTVDGAGRFTGASAIQDAGVLNVTLAGQGRWTVSGDSSLTGLGLDQGALVFASGGAFKTVTARTLAGASGTLVFNVNPSNISGLQNTGDVADHLVITGSSSGTHTVVVSQAPGSTRPGRDETAIPLITDAGGAAVYQLAGGRVSFGGLAEFGLAKGGDVDSPLGLDPDNWYLYNTGLSETADAIINTVSMLGRDWHYSLDALYLRMGDVRATLQSSTSTSNLNSRASGSGNVWVRGRGYLLNAAGDLTGRGFEQYAYGMTVGGDKAFRAENSVNLVGVFMDIGRIDRTFGGHDNTGDTNSFSAGIYGTWLHDKGWYADFVAKADHYKHSFDTGGAAAVSGNYSGNAQGVSLEFGRRLERTGGWWVEPSAQVAVAWLNSAAYRVSPSDLALDVKVGGSRVTQYRGLARFGHHLENSRWAPYGKFGVARTDTAGGTINADGQTLAPDYDGWRFEAGFGASYLVNDRSQVYLDYEYGKAARYERPWSLNLGYRRLW